MDECRDNAMTSRDSHNRVETLPMRPVVSAYDRLSRRCHGLSWSRSPSEVNTVTDWLQRLPGGTPLRGFPCPLHHRQMARRGGRENKSRSGSAMLSKVGIATECPLDAHLTGDVASIREAPRNGIRIGVADTEAEAYPEAVYAGF